jgi:hypothetical protein
MNEMKEMVYYVLGERELAASDVLLELQTRPYWDGAPQKWSDLRALCTAGSVSTTLLELAKEGRVEVAKTGGAGAVSKFKRVVKAQPAPSLSREPRQTRCMKIAKPWKQKYFRFGEATSN